MRVIGYIPIFYGAEYLHQCITSMHNHVEELHIFYTPLPSQGFATKIECPETEVQLKEIAFKASDKIIWHKDTYAYEAEHRNAIMAYSKDYDLVFTLDADEVVDERDIDAAFEMAYNSTKRFFGIGGFINFWKSFNYACYDGFLPVRIINLRNDVNEFAQANCRIYHFSTAQKLQTIEFKWNVSGHRDELRKNWLEDVYLAWSPQNNFPDLHPVSFGLWNAIPFDKTTMPDILKQHPNYNKTTID